MSLLLILAFVIGVAFGGFGVVYLARRVAVSAALPDRTPGLDYFGYLRSRGRIEDPYEQPWGDQ